ncbi:hypothetical protein BUALT_Bualt03G0216100 [Buddleja alternifolia]|uniref:Uncharacterized protein n=1 Tax=Buddleja alternifolia TaxID=168488 RepID=A0AAV6Y015_9LAMI|nr:hypothetical protein BUALT_Bualt03G0216100 [Buddleja alternifolia]
MSSQNKVNMVFIPFPIMSHLVAAVNAAKLLSNRDERLSITVLIMKLPMDTKISSYTKNSPDSRINFVELPENESNTHKLLQSRQTFVSRFLESQKGPARDAVAKLMVGPGSGLLAGFVIDMFCTPMIDVANDFRAPAYVFFTCSAAVLGLMFRLQSLQDDENQDLTGYEDSDAEISVPTYVN